MAKRKFEVWDRSHGRGDSIVIDADSASDAARELCSRRDECEVNEREVCVREMDRNELELIERSEVEGAKSLGEEQNDGVSKSLADLVIASARFASRWTGRGIDLGTAVVSRVAERFPVKKTIGAWRDPVPMILEEIEKERARQRLKWGRSDTDHPLVRPRNGGVHLGFYGIPEAHDAVERKEVECDNERDDWMLILVAEVSRFGQDAIHGRWEGARKGAVRIAAVAAAIVESIDTKLAVEKGRRTDK
jgi:hypothetical protein